MSWRGDSEPLWARDRADGRSRALRVEELRRRVALGAYRVPVLAVADAVIAFYDRGVEDPE